MSGSGMTLLLYDVRVSQKSLHAKGLLKAGRMYCTKLISGVCRRHLSTIACSVASACESGLHLWLCCDGIPCLLVNIVRTGHEQRPTALHRTQALKVRLPTIFLAVMLQCSFQYAQMGSVQISSSWCCCKDPPQWGDQEQGAQH